jgi:hypothetical protein
MFAGGAAMKLYRDLSEGETLQPGDMYRLRNSDMDWCEHTEEQAAEMPDATVGIIGTDDLEWRRPVDAVPQEQYEKLQAELLRARDLRNKYCEASRAYCDEARRLHQGLAQAERLLHEAVEGAEPMNAELASLRQQLAEERAEHGRTAHGRDTLRAKLDAARDLIRQMEIM